MTTAGLALVIFAALMFAPRTVQRIRRRRATAVRRQLRADLMREAELQQVARERDDALALAESNGSLASAYRRANDRMYRFLRDHMTVDQMRDLEQGLSVYDRLVTDVLDRATWGGGES